MPAAAVIPVPIVYASIAAVKTLVVERYNIPLTTAVSVFLKCYVLRLVDLRVRSMPGFKPLYVN